jgi:hypothetical protein
VIREIMLFLHSNGVGTSRAVRIYTTYGASAVQLISENPYRLAHDIGFRTADCQRDNGRGHRIDHRRGSRRRHRRRDPAGNRTLGDGNRHGVPGGAALNFWRGSAQLAFGRPRRRCPISARLETTLPPIRCHADGQVLSLACNLAAIIPPICLRAQSEAGLSEDERLVLLAAALE